MKVLKKINFGEQELNTEIKRLACTKELILAGRALRVIFPGPSYHHNLALYSIKSLKFSRKEQIHKLLDSVVSR